MNKIAVIVMLFSWNVFASVNRESLKNSTTETTDAILSTLPLTSEILEIVVSFLEILEDFDDNEDNKVANFKQLDELIHRRNRNKG